MLFNKVMDMPHLFTLAHNTAYSCMRVLDIENRIILVFQTCQRYIYFHLAVQRFGEIKVARGIQADGIYQIFKSHDVAFSFGEFGAAADAHKLRNEYGKIAYAEYAHRGFHSFGMSLVVRSPNIYDPIKAAAGLIIMISDVRKKIRLFTGRTHYNLVLTVAVPRCFKPTRTFGVIHKF